MPYAATGDPTLGKNFTYFIQQQRPKCDRGKFARNENESINTNKRRHEITFSTMSQCLQSRISRSKLTSIVKKGNFYLTFVNRT